MFLSHRFESIINLLWKKKAKETIVEEMRVREKKWNKKPDKKISYNSDHRETL